MENRRAFLLGGTAAVLAATSKDVHAQSGPIRFIVGTVAGGAIDPYARMIAEHMQRSLGQTIIIDNRPGSGGNLAAGYVKDQPADGTLIWIGTQAFTEINPNAFQNLRWSIDDFTPFIRGVEAPLVFVAHPSVPANNFAEFLKWAEANKGKLSYASYQPGTPSHFLGYQLNDKFKLDLTHVPYRGSGLQANALVGGHSQFGFAQLNSSAPHIDAGKLKGFGITSAQRWRTLPGVPTFAELGHPEFTARVWFGLLVKKGTPDPILARLTDAAKAAHNDPEIRKKLEAQGFEVSGTTGPDQLLANIKEQQQRWGRLVKASGFSAEDRGSTQ